MRRRKAGFTVIEALVAALLTGIGVVAALQGIGAMVKNQATLVSKERMHRLATEKLGEIQAIQDFTTPNGDFTDRNENRYLWQMQINPATLPNSTSTSSTPTSAATTTNAGQLQMLTVTVHPTTSSAPKDSESVSGLVWESPQALNGASQ